MSIEMIQSDAAPKPVGPYSQATKIGNMMFVSGIIPLDPETDTLCLFDGDGAKQAKRVLTTLKNFLTSQGLSLNHVVKTSLFVKNMDDFGAINEVYGQFFTEHKPARACVEVARLPKDVAFELEAVVWTGS